MPLPLKDGYNFNYARVCHPPFYEMTSAEAYADFYGLSFMLSGDALVYSTECATIVRKAILTSRQNTVTVVRLIFQINRGNISC